jgi:hypothetical protein
VVKILGEPDNPIPEEIVPQITVHDNKALLAQKVADALG